MQRTLIAILSSAALVAAAAAQKRDNQYKRVHQGLLRQLLRGQDGAIPKLVERTTTHGDAESWFLLAAAQAATGRVPDALEAARAALAAGLPAGRLFGAPRAMLQPLREVDGFAQLFEEPVRVVHGPLVGEVTPRRVRIWIRTADPADVEVVVTARGDGGREHRARVRTDLDSDNTAVANIAGLEPSSAYRIGVAVAGESIALPFECGFETPPEDHAHTRFMLVFGGGAGFVPQHERMWTTIRSTGPDLLLLLGDNVYSDDPKSPVMQDYCYHRRQSRPEFRALVARTPTYTIWDDHDFGTNDCWGGADIREPKWKIPVWNVFRRNWANPGYGGGESLPGCWYRFLRGDVEFFMLDGRYYRTDPKVEKPSMLGPEQLEWLKRGLAASRATFKVICSPVPWDYRTKGRSKDTWNGFQDERESIFSFAEGERIDGVILMSADRHRSDAWKIERENGYDLYEFNSSRLTNQHVHPEMKKALFSFNKKQSFGRVTFDTTIEDPSVSYDVVDIDGVVQHSLTLRHSQLRHAR